jgi:hypothetical protein
LFSLKIKVSVSSGGDCVRTYRPEIKKGSYNNIVVHVKTAVADNLLFYLGSAKFVSLIYNFLKATGYVWQSKVNQLENYIEYSNSSRKISEVAFHGLNLIILAVECLQF